MSLSYLIQRAFAFDCFSLFFVAFVPFVALSGLVSLSRQKSARLPGDYTLYKYMNALDIIATTASGLLLARSLFKMVRDRMPEDSPAQASSPCVEPHIPNTTSGRPTRRGPRRVAKGSVLDILRRNSGAALFVRPLCWTDQHTELLGIRFNELPPCDTPIPINLPGSPPPRGHMDPSPTIKTLSTTLDDILSHKIAHPVDLARAMRTIMATLWPNSFRRSLFVPDLHLYFGDKVYREAVKTQMMWNYPGSSCMSSQGSLNSSQSTLRPDSQLPSQSPNTQNNAMTGLPMVCFMGKEQLASIRRNMYRIAPGPNGQLNEPVLRLHRLRSSHIAPKNPDEDAHIAGIMLAMAQKHFYPSPGLTAIFRNCPAIFRKGPANGVKPFRDLKMRLITHDCDEAQFIVYTGHITAAFLERFSRPHKVPAMEDADSDLGIDIDYVRVPIWPILGLRERLGKALGVDVVGPFDPEAMETWEDDAPLSSGKRKRATLGEISNRSFDDSEEESSSSVPRKKQCLPQGPPLELAA